MQAAAQQMRLVAMIGETGLSGRRLELMAPHLGGSCVEALAVASSARLSIFILSGVEWDEEKMEMRDDGMAERENAWGREFEGGKQREREPGSGTTWPNGPDRQIASRKRMGTRWEMDGEVNPSEEAFGKKIMAWGRKGWETRTRAEARHSDPRRRRHAAFSSSFSLLDLNCFSR